MPNPFVVCFVSTSSSPQSWTIEGAMDAPKHFEWETGDSEVLLVLQLFCTRNNDDGYSVTQYLGSGVLDVSQCDVKSYSVHIKDSSNHKNLAVGRVDLRLVDVPAFSIIPAESRLVAHRIQSPQCARRLFNAAEANLTWIEGFSPRGLPPIVCGLKRVHSPYYVNYMGVTMPSGAFCMIPTTTGHGSKHQALKSHWQRLNVSLARNTMSAEDFVEGVAHMMTSNIKSKHLRCLSVVADMLTLHTRMDIRYTPDVQFTPTPMGTERWEIPREPGVHGHTSYTGDCEDYAREVFQHCKELRAWVRPNIHASALESLVAILHLYVPTIEQGAVDSEAHSKYITYDAAFRNHIWAAMHPRRHWETKCSPPISLETLYKHWPQQPCERTLPVIHLEGTGDVYPVVTARKPGYIAKIQRKRQLVERKYPWLARAETPDMSLQCDHRSDFYKYAIACMTDIFADQGLLDFTYTTGGKYGANIYSWSRGQYNFRPSTKHSENTMRDIRNMISIERPVGPILTRSKIIRKPTLGAYALRYGQSAPFQNIPEEATHAVYNVGGLLWHEVYFTMKSDAASSAEVNSEKSCLI